MVRTGAAAPLSPMLALISLLLVPSCSLSLPVHVASSTRSTCSTRDELRDGVLTGGPFTCTTRSSRGRLLPILHAADVAGIRGGDGGSERHSALTAGAAQGSGMRGASGSARRRTRGLQLAMSVAGGSISSSNSSDDPSITARVDDNSSDRLPRELMPITLGVFAQMLGEGISLSSLPLYLTRLGASPVMVGLAISCFSISQMTFAPLLVGLSSRMGRSIVLRICLAGAAASSLLIAFSGSVYGVVAGRALAGAFAACVPVAQSGVTDIVSTDQTALGLSRVSAAAQLGVVVGPLASATFQEGFEALGVPHARCLPAVFVLNALNALFVLAQMTLMDRRGKRSAPTIDTADNKSATKQEKGQASVASITENADDTQQEGTLRYAQAMLRTITIVVGWTAILSNSIYGLFAPHFMGFKQAQLSATYSAAAVLMVLTQIIFPRLVAKVGEHHACTLGILSVGTGIGGLSLIKMQPIHSLLYMLNRSGAAIADTSTAALVASASRGRDDRSRNLGLLTSTRAAARVFSPLISGKLYQLSRNDAVAPGALPYLIASCLCFAVAPLPSV